jgi:hypothetical protein
MPASHLTQVPPIVVGQLVRVRSYDDHLPGTVVGLERREDGMWEVRVEVLASFGIGTSRHVIDGAGHEADTRSEHHGLECA